MEQEIIEVSSSVYHGIRDIRNSVLMNPVSDREIRRIRFEYEYRLGT
jgi:hypothetical protein